MCFMAEDLPRNFVARSSQFEVLSSTSAMCNRFKHAAEMAFHGFPAFQGIRE